MLIIYNLFILRRIQYWVSIIETIDPSLNREYSNQLVGSGQAAHLPEALSCFQEMARRLPQQPIVWCNLAVVFKQSGLLEHEFDCLSSAVAVEADKLSSKIKVAFDLETLTSYASALLRSHERMSPPDFNERIQKGTSM